MRKRQIINCNVFDCKHCDVDKIMCNLKEIKIASSNFHNNKQSTMCDNYEVRKDN